MSCKRDGAKMQSFSRLKKIFLEACFTWSSNWHLIMLRLIRVRNENVSFEQAAVLEMGVIAHRHSKKLIYPQSALTRWVPSITLFWKVLKQIKLSLFFLFAFIFKRPSLASLQHNFMRFYIFSHTCSYIYLIILFYCILVYFSWFDAQTHGKRMRPQARHLWTNWAVLYYHGCEIIEQRKITPGFITKEEKNP